jgi:uncharacterized FAD-dependent dehydrogenase
VELCRLGVKAAPLHDLYPAEITEALREALLRFNRKLPGFAGPEGLLHGVETRTSSPVRPMVEWLLHTTVITTLNMLGLLSHPSSRVSRV